MRRWMWWLTPPWGAKIRRRQALAVLRDWQNEEREAARARLAGVAEMLDSPPRVPQMIRPPALTERPSPRHCQAAGTRLGGQPC